MTKSLLGSGGGSNKIVKPPIRTGSPGRGSSPGAADGIGQTTQFVKDEVGRVSSFNSNVPLGNAKALDVQGGGPGRGREVHHCGSQGSHGPANPGHSPARRDILSEFGPDKRTPK